MFVHGKLIKQCGFYVFRVAKNFSTVPENSPSLGDKVCNLATLEVSLEVLFSYDKVDIFPYFELLNSYQVLEFFYSTSEFP